MPLQIVLQRGWTKYTVPLAYENIFTGKILTMTIHSGSLDYASYFLETKHMELKVFSLGRHLSALAEIVNETQHREPFLWLYVPATSANSHGRNLPAIDGSKTTLPHIWSLTFL